MKVVYAGDPRMGPNSIFLAGPTPRDENTLSWRPEALNLLEGLGFDGYVYVPEPKEGHMGKWPTYDEQCEWEQVHLDFATCILFWVPRDMTNMPAMTTNVEFGLYAKTGRVVLGYPAWAARSNRYLAFCAKKWGIPYEGTLRETLIKAIMRAR
jgi:hypothetical protein